MNKKAIAAAMSVAALAATLAGCSGGGDAAGAGANSTNCTNKIVHADAPKVSVWAWYPNMATVVDNFNNSH
ncbi:hypothetical protein J7E80_09115, partial [Arthrobacter sp. ISL-28]|nr:hypothetical protein [Arthrobacter sp. ISL-28]